MKRSMVLRPTLVSYPQEYCPVCACQRDVVGNKRHIYGKEYVSCSSPVSSPDFEVKQLLNINDLFEKKNPKRVSSGDFSTNEVFVTRYHKKKICSLASESQGLVLGVENRAPPPCWRE